MSKFELIFNIVFTTFMGILAACIELTSNQLTGLIFVYIDFILITKLIKIQRTGEGNDSTEDIRKSELKEQSK